MCVREGEREREAEAKTGRRRHMEDLKDLDTDILTPNFFPVALCQARSFT